MELSIEDIQNKFEKLPEDLRWAIMGAKIDEKLVQIGQNFNLNIRQLGQLSLETHAVMLGFMHPDDFESSILKSLGLDEEKTKLIANTVFDKIIKDVRDRLIEYRGGMKPEHEIKEKVLPKEIFEKEKTENNNPIATQEIPEKKEEEKVISKVISNKLLNTVKANSTENTHILTETKPNDTLKQERKIDPYREIPE